MAGDRKQGINKCWPKLGPATYVLFAMYKKCSYKSSEAICMLFYIHKKCQTIDIKDCLLVPFNPKGTVKIVTIHHMYVAT